MSECNPPRLFSPSYVQTCLKGLLRLGFRVSFIGPEFVGVIFKIRLPNIEDNLIVSYEVRSGYLKGSVFHCCEKHSHYVRC